MERQNTIVKFSEPKGQCNYCLSGQAMYRVTVWNGESVDVCESCMEIVNAKVRENKRSRVALQQIK